MVDKRRKYYVVLDTETCPIDKDFEGVSANNMFVYDCGFSVCDKHGTIYEEYSFVNRGIFFGEKSLMKSSYYADKLPQYYKDIKSGKRKVASLYEIRKTLADVMKKYNTNIIIAYNARFDDTALNVTQRWETKSKYRWFLPYGTIVWDSMKMVQDVVAKTPTYKRFCFENGFVTAHKTPRPQIKAETVYRYITQNPDFIESHTGLEDVIIETAIFAYCMAKHKKMRKALYS